MKALLLDLLKAYQLIFRVARPEKISLALLGLMVIVQGIIPACFVILTKLIIDNFQKVEYVVYLACAWAMLFVVEMVLSSWTFKIQGDLTDKLTNHIQSSVMTKIDSLGSIELFERADFKNDVQVVNSQSSYQPINIMIFSVSFLKSALIILSTGLALGSLAWFIPILVILAAIPEGLISFKLQKATWNALVSQSENTRKMRYYYETSFSERNAQEIKTFDVMQFFKAKYDQSFADVYAQMSRMRTKQAIQSSAVALLPAVLNGGILLWFLLYQKESLGYGFLVVFLQSIMLIRGNISLAISDFSNLSDSIFFVNILRNVLEKEDALCSDMSSEISGNDGNEMLSSSSTHQIHQQGIQDVQFIEFSDVSFAYTGEGNTIEKLSFSIREGEKIAIVGANGAGKTTLVKLLLRLYDPKAGHIYVEGKNLKSMSVKEWRKQIGIVFQEFGKYDLTLRENVALSDIAQISQTDRIYKALKKAGLNISSDNTSDDASDDASEDTDTNQLVLDDILGRKFGDTDLSGGQWQKLAIARTFFKQDVRLYVLDEPSAALDPKSEAAIFEHFAEMTKGVTSILITHKLSSIIFVDRILVLDQGCVVEEGTHQDLLVQDGLYAEMWRLQAKNYKI